MVDKYWDDGTDVTFNGNFCFELLRDHPSEKTEGYNIFLGL